MEVRLKKISGDASFREFYRIQKNTKTSILVKANKDKFRNLIVYAAINQILNKNKIKAPKLINEYFKSSMMEIEDLGSVSFLEFIKQKKNKFKFYINLIDLIFKLQGLKFKKRINFKKYKIILKNYNIKELHRESDLFFDWYLRNNCKKKNFKNYKVKIKKELNSLYKKLYFQNKCFVHRDFHASNVMCNKKHFALIDSQDALIGNLFYDLVSLIDDVRIKLSFKLKLSLFNYYLKKQKFIKKNEIHFAKQDFDILSIQRNLKILGIFVRLFLRDQKPIYLKLLPYTWSLIELRLKNPMFDNLKKLLLSAVPKKNRKKIKFYAS